jgi:phage terminase large subunit-like protein
MGLRGINSHIRRNVAEQLVERELPWLKPGLSRVGKIIAFLEFLPITKGQLIGSNLKLLPDQRRFIQALYGSNAVKLGVFSQPRGNGKTGLTAGLMLCHLLGPEAEFRGECYSAAIDRKQASLIADEMEAIILEVPEFASILNMKRFPYRTFEVMAGPGIGSRYEALSADGRRGMGLAPSFWCFDELAQTKDRKLFDSLQTAMGKRKRALGVVISTQAADNEHPLSELIDYGLRGTDPTILVHLRAAPVDANPFDRKTIRSVNPAFGKFLSAEDVFAEAVRAREIPAFESAFRNTRLNQRIAADHDEVFLTPQVWERCAGPVDEALFTDGRPVYAGMDLSTRVDLTAFVLACQDGDGNMHLLPMAWTPGDTVQERTHKDRAPYDAWVRMGLLTAAPGPVIDYDWVATEIATRIKSMNINKVYFDDWKIDDMRAAFNRIGFPMPMQPFRQGIKTFGSAVSLFEGLATDGKLRHGGHKVLSWCVANTMMERDAMNNRKPNKKRSTGRIDLAVAAIMAVKAAEGAPIPELASLIA